MRSSPALSSLLWARGMAKDNKPRSGSRFANPSQSSSQSQKAQASQAETPQQNPQSNQTQSPSSQSLKKDTAQSQAREGDFATSESQPPKPVEHDAEPQLPFGSLPDLTQGIPSTLEYETTGSKNTSALSAIDGASGSSGRGQGELPASAYVSSSERRRQKFYNWAFGLSGGFLVAATIFAGRNWDEEDLRRHPDAPNGWGLGLWWNRVSARTKEVLTYYHEPAFEKLLPDPDPSFERPYTLCISMEDMLIHSEWSREHGWRVAKRPGVDYFLRYLSQYYEVVLFTSVPAAIAEPVIRKLDPFRFIMWPLFREATKYKDGEIVKDLSYLNRDLSKVILIDTNSASVRAQPENAIILPKWTGDAKDNELVALIPFLEYIYTMQYGDVRQIMKSFDGKHIPTEFARREAIARAEFQKQLESQGAKKRTPTGKGGMSALGSLLGLKPGSMSVMVSPDGEPNPADEIAKGKMLQDIARERGQRTYEMLEKEIRENGEKWLKEEAAMQEKAQEEAMQSMKSSFTGWFVKPEDQPKPAAASDEEKKA